MAGYLTIVLAQWGRHLVEVAFSSTVDVPDASERAERAARAAVALIANG